MATYVWDIKGRYKEKMNTESRGDRGLFGAGFTEPVAKSNVDYFTISTLGNAADFGDVSLARYATGGVSSHRRSLAAGGHSPSSDVIDYAEFAHTGNYADFGNLSASRGYMEQGAASNTRGIWGGGNSPSPVGTVNIMEYVTMATIGNATDFGDLSAAKTNASSGVNNTTRGIWAGGYNPSPGDTHVNVIEYVTIATTGNVTDFGDLTVARTYLWGGSNVTRGIWTGGNHPGNPSYDVMDFVTIASTGNATDFGDSATAALEAECVSNATRMVRGGGASGPAPAYTPTTVNMDYVTIASTGDAADFGDLTVKKAGHFAGSNAHGGLDFDLIPRASAHDPYLLLVPGSTRALVVGGSDSAINTMCYFNISSSGDNAADFGDLSVARGLFGGLASTTRACFGGGMTPSVSDVIDYATIATEGNATDFGNLQQAKRETGGGANSTRGIWFGGWDGSSGAGTDEMDYITIATTGNATDFGNLLSNKRGCMGATASPTRAVQGGGYAPPNNVNVIEYVTIGTTGNSTDFGDLSVTRRGLSATGSDTRGVFPSGHDGSNALDVIDYITIASTGDAADFGDLKIIRNDPGSTSNNIRGVVCGGSDPSASNHIEYLTLATIGNGTDFGDLNYANAGQAAASGSHGGVQ